MVIGRNADLHGRFILGFLGGPGSSMIQSSRFQHAKMAEDGAIGLVLESGILNLESISSHRNGE
jgi:hypothetical protein